MRLETVTQGEGRQLHYESCLLCTPRPPCLPDVLTRMEQGRWEKKELHEMMRQHPAFGFDCKQFVKAGSAFGRTKLVRIEAGKHHARSPAYPNVVLPLTGMEDEVVREELQRGEKF